MEQNSMETDDQMDENLLEPLSEVSYSEREEKFSSSVKGIIQHPDVDDKDPNSSLPDARAKMLHLQRIPTHGGGSGSGSGSGGGSGGSASGSSSDNAKNPTSKKRNSKSHSGDKDDNTRGETVSLSLDELIRCGVTNHVKKSANFKSNFKFGKPDDDISLRVNPSANLFYEHSNEPYSDSNSDTYESSGEKDGPDEPRFSVTSNGNITNGNGLSNDHAPVKRKRGRPALTDVEKSQRAAEKEALRLQNQSILNSSSMKTEDFTMAMGHSIFDTSSPKKRGRPPKKIYPHFLNSTAQSDQDTHNNSSQLENDVNETEFPKIKKKRGRKPKSYHLELAAAQANESSTSIYQHNDTDVSNVSSQQALTDSTMPIVSTGPKKRGRKPKYLHNYHLKLEQQSVQPGQLQIKKKRGRKPKSFYLQQMAERANESAPAIFGGSNIKMEVSQDTDHLDTTGAVSFDINAYAHRRGRKPKAYYQHLAALDKQDSGDSSLNAADVSKNLSSQNDSILFDEPRAKKKRGRKPKSYYWNLQMQQEAAENQNSSEPPQDGKGDNLSSQGHLNTQYVATKRIIPKPPVRPIIQRAYIRRILPQPKLYRRPGLDVPIAGMPLKKKRGRKPKNYQPQFDEQIVQPANSNVSERNHQTPSVQALQERNRVLHDLYEQRCDENRILKQRISNLTNEKVEQNMSMGSSWTTIELCKAFSLQRLNIPQFNHLREKFSIPMPSQDDVRKFVRGIRLVPGIQSTMLQMLECDGQINQEHEKMTILQISYIKTTELFEYDESLDLIVGPHKYLTLIVARGLYKNWSQLVYFNFDTRVAKQHLNQTIEALHKIDYAVVALASNFEEGKSDVFSELSINYGKGFFQHPITQEKVQCFYYLNDMLQATNAHFFGGQLTIEDNQQTRQPINKQAVMQAIHKNYRRIPIPRELLAWTDNDMNNVEAIHTFFSQFTINLLRISSPDDRATKNVAEFISIMKSYAELMSRPHSIDADVIDTVNFDRYMEFQNKRLDKIHTRLLRLDNINSNDATRKRFREAMMMSIVSLKMLRKSVMTKYKNATFSTEAITNEVVRTKLNELISKYNFRKTMPPTQLFRIIKDIFLGEDCSVKIESNVAFFYPDKVTAAEVNGRNESHYANFLINWICELYSKKSTESSETKDLKRKLKKVEETFCSIQNPNFRICEKAVSRVTKEIIERNAFESSMNDIVRLYVIQRHLLRIKYFNENHITRISINVQMTINLEE